MARFYYYSVEELGGGEGGGGGGRTKPRPKCVEKPSAARFAHPLRGAEVLVAVRGPSPGEGGGKNEKEERLLNQNFIYTRPQQLAQLARKYANEAASSFLL